MSRMATVLALSVAVLLSGCGASNSPSPSTTSPGQPSGTQTPNIAGNWQFNAASNIPGNPSLTFAGNIGQTNSAVSGALHVDGSSCFNQLTIMGLTGTVTAGSTSLTSTALNGQVVTFTGKFTNFTFTGTYNINGGCDAGDQGSVTGAIVTLADADAWSGTFTSSAQKAFNASGNFAQSTTASPEGSLGITGTATFDTQCFSAETISAGSFPSGNFIIGTRVSLEIETDNGTVAFDGTVNPITEIINGTYSVVGGTCDQTGTAVLALGGQWDY
jgi:hypothetical protein